MTPIVGLGFGLAIFDTRLIKQSLEVLLTQVLVSLLVSTLYFWISPLSYASSELIARTISNHFGMFSLLLLVGLLVCRFKEKRSKQYRARSSHCYSSDAAYLYCWLWFS